MCAGLDVRLNSGQRLGALGKGGGFSRLDLEFFYSQQTHLSLTTTAKHLLHFIFLVVGKSQHASYRLPSVNTENWRCASDVPPSLVAFIEPLDLFLACTVILTMEEDQRKRFQ